MTYFGLKKEKGFKEYGTSPQIFQEKPPVLKEKLKEK